MAAKKSRTQQGQAKKYSADLRLPTAARYAYIELHVEGTIEEIIDAYYEAGSAYWARQKKAVQ